MSRLWRTAYFVRGSLMRKDKDAVGGRNVRRSHAKMRKTLEPQVRSASTRFKNRFRSEACRRTRQRSRRRAVAERALRRNPRPTGRPYVLLRAGAGPFPKYRFRGTSAGIQKVPEADRSNALPPSALQRRSVTSAVSVCHHLALGTGFEPATARVLVWCSIQAELTELATTVLEPMSGTQRAKSAIPRRTDLGTPCAAGQSAPTELAFKETSVGVEPTQSRFAGGRLPVWLRRRVAIDSQKVSSPGFEPGPRPSQSRVRSTTLRGRE
jgi:hypothetical protein